MAVAWGQTAEDAMMRCLADTLGTAGCEAMAAELELEGAGSGAACRVLVDQALGQETTGEGLAVSALMAELQRSGRTGKALADLWTVGSLFACLYSSFGEPSSGYPPPRPARPAPPSPAEIARRQAYVERQARLRRQMMARRGVQTAAYGLYQALSAQSEAAFDGPWLPDAKVSASGRTAVSKDRWASTWKKAWARHAQMQMKAGCQIGVVEADQATAACRYDAVLTRTTGRQTRMWGTDLLYLRQVDGAWRIQQLHQKEALVEGDPIHVGAVYLRVGGGGEAPYERPDIFTTVELGARLGGHAPGLSPALEVSLGSRQFGLLGNAAPLSADLFGRVGASVDLARHPDVRVAPTLWAGMGLLPGSPNLLVGADLVIGSGARGRQALVMRAYGPLRVGGPPVVPGEIRAPLNLALLVDFRLR